MDNLFNRFQQPAVRRVRPGTDRVTRCAGTRLTADRSIGGKPMARNVRVASISFGGGGGPMDGRYERARTTALELLEEAALDRPDIVCLPETFTGLGCGEAEWIGSAETVPGPTTDALAAVARRHGMWVICPIVQREGGQRYNAAVLLDRRGAVAGIYHKIHPTIAEIRRGITPGTQATVFETD